MPHLFRIAANTFRESIREPVYFLMLLAALLLIGHYPWMTIFVFFEQLKLVVDGAMATTMLFGFAVSVLCASYTVSREMRNGTVLLLLSKPVPRWSFVLGKIAGITLAALLFSAICSLASVIAVYIAVDQFRMELHLYGTFIALIGVGCAFGMLMNFLKGTSFAEFATYATAVLVTAMFAYCLKFRPHPELSMTDLGKALFMLNIGVVLMATLAVAAATRLDVVPTMCLCSILFFLGLMSSHIFLRNDEVSPLIKFICDAGYAIVPNWQFFWLADAIAVGRTIPLAYVINGCIYGAIYFILACIWAVVLFQDREAAVNARD